MHQGEHFQNLLKWGLFLGHSLTITKRTLGLFYKNLQFDILPPSPTISRKRVL